jgi:transposase-like protein
MNAARYLGYRLAVGEATATRDVERALRRTKGSVRDAAGLLGVTEKSLHVWLGRFPQLAKAATLRQGREAVGARSKIRSARTAKAKTTRSRKGSRE